MIGVFGGGDRIFWRGVKRWQRSSQRHREEQVRPSPKDRLAELDKRAARSRKLLGRHK
jgi:hypothetical protein